MIKTKTIEVTTIQDLLVFTRGNQAEVARMLDITRTTLSTMINEKTNHAVFITGDVDRGFEYELIKSIKRKGERL